MRPPFLGVEGAPSGLFFWAIACNVFDTSEEPAPNPVSNPFLRILTLLFPLLNAYARVALNRHWPSDAAAAMALGFMAAYFFWNFKKFQQKTPLPRV